MLLSAKHLEKSFRKRKVVKDISVEVKTGEVVGLLGPNGAGKTTVFYMIVGLIAADHGEIFLDDRNITHLPMYRRARQGIGYLPQEPSVFRKLTVEENLLAILETLDLSPSGRQERLHSLLKELNISHLSNSKAYALSGGERRRVEITRSLVTSPHFLLLDEPFAGIDPIAIIDIQKIIGQLKAKGIGILITDHNVQETLEITDRSYIISEGEILESGTSQDIANSSKAKAIYLGEKFRFLG
ncbi:MAG TPA: LPS export ABC transporter ATP-binding protein [Nitrospiria bacterium]|jgi:lipopolysaccharide export system ATP-binding protein|nr:LPS export ABC transporter ATP-binding protein [Nitrospiria bacterium]